MAKMLDFTKAKKPTLPIKFEDGSMVHVYTPSKAEYDELAVAQEYFATAIDDDAESSEELYKITARLMSNNKTGRVLAADELKTYLDIGDLVVFYRAYTDFITEAINEKN